MALREQVIIAAANGFELQIPHALASDLANQIAEAANALPKRGLELCGLLIGQHLPAEGTVTALFPLQCRYAEGPSYRASESELRELLQPLQPFDNIIGFYRSRNDGALELDAQDALLIGLLNRQHTAIVVIRQQKHIPGEGRLLIWRGPVNNGEIAGAGDVFSTNQWMTPTRPPARPPRATAITATPPASRPSVTSDRHNFYAPALQTAELPLAIRKPSRALYVKISLSACTVLGLLFLTWRMQKSPLPPDDAPANQRTAAATSPLVITPGGAPLELGFQPISRETAGVSNTSNSPEPNPVQSLKSWIRREHDHRLREVAVRELARLGRQDPETLPLLGETAQSDPSETVRAAALESIAREWKVNSVTRSFFETRARIDSSLAVRRVAERELSSAGNASVPNPGTTATPAEPRPPSQQAVAIAPDPRARKESTPSPAAVEPPRREARRFVPPPTKVASPNRTDLTAPTPLAGLGSKLEIPIHQPGLSTVPPRITAPVRTATAAPAPIRPPAASEYTAPVFLQQSQRAVIPSDLRWLVRHETVVSLRLEIDASGKVTKVYPPESSANLERLLWGYYATAVRRWMFQPARRDNKPIAGELVLKVRVPAYNER